MSKSQASEAFFIGWQKSIDASLLRFLAIVAAIVLAALALIGVGMGYSVNDPSETLLKLGGRDATGGPVRGDEWLAGQSFTGTIVNLGYPVLHMPADAVHVHGRTFIMSGNGKVAPTLPAISGAVTIEGSLLKRGALDMIVVEGTVKAAPESPAVKPTTAPLGRWRAIGEICDGKCYLGGMNPGMGLAHRACANLCLTGEVPPVFVTAGPVAGSSYLLLLGQDGGQPPVDVLRNLTGFPVELTGDVERIGSMLVFKVDLRSARRL